MGGARGTNNLILQSPRKKRNSVNLLGCFNWLVCISSVGSDLLTFRSNYVSNVIDCVREDKEFLQFKCDPCLLQCCRHFFNMVKYPLLRHRVDDDVVEIDQNDIPFYAYKDNFHCY